MVTVFVHKLVHVYPNPFKSTQKVLFRKLSDFGGLRTWAQMMAYHWSQAWPNNLVLSCQRQEDSVKTQPEILGG